MKRKGSLSLGFILLSVLALHCSRNDIGLLDQANDDRDPAVPEGTVHLSKSSRDLVGIQVEKLDWRECNSVLKAMGKILAPQTQTAIVSHAFPGRVAEIQVTLGDWVEKGQALAVLESHDVGEAKAEFARALAALDLAKANFDREEQLLEEGIGTRKSYLGAEAEYKVAQSNMEAADKKLHVLGFTEEQAKEIAETHEITPTITLHAPLAGKVVDIGAVRGAMVDQSMEILTIIDPTRLWVDAEIYEKDLTKVRNGQKVEIAVPAYPEERFEGTVNYIGDLVDEETRTITVRAEVANDQQRLKPGMFAEVHVLLNDDRRTLVVPSAAILEEGHHKLVFVREKDHFVRREVETGVLEGDYQQILAGLEPGDEVVTEGNHQLRSVLRADVLQAAHAH
jgi:cobalt-zinc-cadmium efflux system membrane fusion protein